MGSLREGRAAASQTGPGQGHGHKTCPCTSRRQWHRDLQSPPLVPSQGSSRGPPGGLQTLPCLGSEHTVEEGEQERNMG